MTAVLLGILLVLSLAACGGKTDDTKPAETKETSAADETKAAGETEAADETKADAEGKTLRVAMECGYAPYNWTQSTDANGAVKISGSSDYAFGYDVMMAKHIAEELGYTLETVSYTHLDVYKRQAGLRPLVK